MNPIIRQILNKHDEPDSYEFHSKFNYPQTEARAKDIASRLEAMGIQLTFEDAVYNQDASFSIALILRSFEKQKEDALYQPAVRFSNFGNLASITWTQLIPETDLENIVRELDFFGFTYIPESELDHVYDGVMPDKNTFRTWWIRYFDWL